MYGFILRVSLVTLTSEPAVHSGAAKPIWGQKSKPLFQGQELGFAFQDFDFKSYLSLKPANIIEGLQVYKVRKLGCQRAFGAPWAIKRRRVASISRGVMATHTTLEGLPGLFWAKKPSVHNCRCSNLALKALKQAGLAVSPAMVRRDLRHVVSTCIGFGPKVPTRPTTRSSEQLSAG